MVLQGSLLETVRSDVSAKIPRCQLQKLPGASQYLLQYLSKCHRIGPWRILLLQGL